MSSILWLLQAMLASSRAKCPPPQRQCYSSPVNGVQDPGCTLIEGPNGGLGGGAFSLGK